MTASDPGTAEGRTRGRIDDTTLAVRAQEGDASALESLLRRYQDPMYRVAVRVLGNPSDAEDAVQEAFVAAWRSLARYRGGAQFSTWLYRIVTNRCLNTIRARPPHPTMPLDEYNRAIVTGPGTSPGAASVVSGERAALRDALMALGVEQRMCWVLRENDGLGYDEIGEIVGLSPDAVRGRIHRARRNLAQSMRDWQ